SLSRYLFGYFKLIQFNFSYFTLHLKHKINVVKVIYKVIYHPFFNKILLKFNSILFSLFPKIVRLNPSGKYKFRFSNNDSIILNTNQTSYLTHVLYWNGIEEFEYSNIFIE